MVDAQLADAVPDAPSIPDMAIGQSIEARGNQRPSTLIAQAQPPPPERLSLPELQHVSFIDDPSRLLKAAAWPALRPAGSARRDGGDDDGLDESASGKNFGRGGIFIVPKHLRNSLDCTPRCSPSL
jgi:hypothetical protein